MMIVSGKKITIDFPVFASPESRSIKRQIIQNVIGGTLSKYKTKTVVRALDNIDFEFKEGDRIGLIGENGSGKTTLLRVIAGIYYPTYGQIQVKGLITSMLSITLGMDNEASGLENIYLRSKLLGLSNKKINFIIDSIIDFSELEDFIHLPIRTYSSGMLMRLAFSITTAIESDIILMDEWLSVGDSKFIIKANERLNTIVNNSKLLVLASHDLNLINSLCNVKYNIIKGKLI